MQLHVQPYVYSQHSVWASTKNEWNPGYRMQTALSYLDLLSPILHEQFDLLSHQLAFTKQSI